MEAKKGSPVRVTLSKGSPLVNVPDVRGETEVGAGIKIRAEDLAISKRTRAFHPIVKEGLVIAQDPPPGTGAPHGFSVNLLISRGRRPPDYSMPQLLEKTLPEARGILENMGMLIEEVIRKDAPLPRNHILAQNPLPGSIVNKNRKIVLTVSTGLGAIQ